LTLLCAVAALTALSLSSEPVDARPPRADCLRPRRQPDAVAERVVLIGIDRGFACALQTALDPWGLRLIESDADSPGSSMPSTSLSARAIAREQGARAVIWLGQDPAGFALWVYDAQSDRSVSRAVPEPPFRSSVAASLALSVKTTLRMVGLGSEAPPPEPEPEAARALDTEAPPPAPHEPAPAPPRPAPHWQLGAHGGVQLGPLGGEKQDVRYGLELRWTPATLGFRPWFALELSAGVPLRVRGRDLEGRVWDAASTFALGVTQPLTEVWAVGVSAGAGLHVISVSGTAREDGVHVDDLQANPTLRLGAELQAQLGALVIGLEPLFDVWLRAQRYTVNGASVLDHRRRAFGLALALWVPLD
jgi:hypothetical protein